MESEEIKESKDEEDSWKDYIQEEKEIIDDKEKGIT